MGREAELIEQIERDVLDDPPKVAAALRKVVALSGGRAFDELKHWALSELQGYGADDELPEYRVIFAGIFVDAAVAGGYVTGQQFDEWQLPDKAREIIANRLEMRRGVAELQEMAARTDSTTVKLNPPGAQYAAHLIDEAANQPFQKITALYWQVPVSAIAGVLDAIATRLTQFVAELRESGAITASGPSRQELQAAVAKALPNITITGPSANVTVQSSVSGTQSASQDRSDTDRDAGWWSSWSWPRRVAALALGVSTLLAAAAGAWAAWG